MSMRTAVCTVLLLGYSVLWRLGKGSEWMCWSTFQRIYQLYLNTVLAWAPDHGFQTSTGFHAISSEGGQKRHETQWLYLQFVCYSVLLVSHRRTVTASALRRGWSVTLSGQYGPQFRVWLLGTGRQWFSSFASILSFWHNNYTTIKHKRLNKSSQCG